MIKKGDTVIVIAGKDKGKKGKVLSVAVKSNAVVVERVNVVKRHLKATRQFQGGIIEKTAPINVCKVMLVCPKCNEPSKVKNKEVEGKTVRACKRCQEVIDKI